MSRDSKNVYQYNKKQYTFQLILHKIRQHSQIYHLLQQVNQPSRDWQRFTAYK